MAQSKLSQFFITALMVISASAVALDEPNNTAVSAARQAELTHMVKQDCGSCHGMTLKGGLGSAILPEDLNGKSIEFITQTILLGRAGTAMPPWQALLTEQEARWIAEQLKQGKFN